MQGCSVGGLVCEDRPAFESVLRLDVGVCNPVVLILVDVTEQEDAEVLASLSSSERGGAEQSPFTEVHVAMLEMAEKAWISSKQTQEASSRKTSGESNVAPAAFSLEVFLLVKQVGIRGSNNFICSIVGGVASLETTDVLVAEEIRLRRLSCLHF